MSKKNNSPEQKVAWKTNQKLGSRFIFIGTPLNNFNFPKREYALKGKRIK
jgi:hypothetical protein